MSLPNINAVQLEPIAVLNRPRFAFLVKGVNGFYAGELIVLSLDVSGEMIEQCASWSQVSRSHSAGRFLHAVG